MSLPDKGPYLVRFAPATPLPGDDMAERPAGRAWLTALTPRGTAGAGPFTRARAYARTAPVSHLLLEPGTVRLWINENTRPDGNTYAHYVPQPNPTIRIPTLDASQWRDLTLITRHLAGRWSAMAAEDVLTELAAVGARNGIRLLPTLEQCAVSCPCPSNAAVWCKHAATALYQVARALDAQPLALLVLRGRAATDFFAGLHDPDHRSLQPRYEPARTAPPAVLAETAYDQWEHSQPPLPPRLEPPPAPAHPEPVALPGIDATAMHLIAVDTAHRAHALLNTLTSRTGRTTDLTRFLPTGLKDDAARLATHHDLHIPLQRRLQHTLGMSEDDLTHAVESARRPSASE